MSLGAGVEAVALLAAEAQVRLGEPGFDWSPAHFQGSARPAGSEDSEQEWDSCPSRPDGDTGLLGRRGGGGGRERILDGVQGTPS